MEKIEAYDQMENVADLAMPTDQNRIVTFESNRRKKSRDFNAKCGGGALGGTRTPTILLTATSRQRVYQFRHERLGGRRDMAPGRINGADVTNR